jgi:hypothetical protein
VQETVQVSGGEGDDPCHVDLAALRLKHDSGPCYLPFSLLSFLPLTRGLSMTAEATGINRIELVQEPVTLGDIAAAVGMAWDARSRVHYV